MVTDVLLPSFPGRADRGFLGGSNVIIIKRLGSMMLKDTGCYGDRPVLLSALASNSIEPMTISTVLITHLRYDHCLNLVVFPQAKIIIGPRNGNMPIQTYHILIMIRLCRNPACHLLHLAIQFWKKTDIICQKA